MATNNITNFTFLIKIDCCVLLEIVTLKWHFYPYSFFSSYQQMGQFWGIINPFHF